MENKKEQQFKQVYEQSRDKIYRLCLGFTGNNTDADDLFQEILIKVWSNLENFRNESNISTWIYRIATNTAFLYLNRKKITEQRITNLDLVDSIIESNEIDSSYKEIQINQLYKSISLLKEMDRVIISLMLDNNSYEDIANITGFTKSNVGVRINRIKKSLNKKLS